MTAASPLCEEGVRALHTAAKADQFAVRREYLFHPPFARSHLVHVLNDPRDAPILFLFINVATITLPLAAALYLFKPASHALGTLYFAANFVMFLQRFMLALHYSEHRRLFKAGLGALNWVAPVLLAPLFGIPSGMYRLHHCVMHHVSNNAGGADASSTEPWQRDNFLHFLRYWARHFLAAWLVVPLYALRTRRWALAGACVATEGSYLLAVAALWRAAPAATTWVFLVPYAVSSFALMFGNWSQHIFINPVSPESNHGLAYNCIGCLDNQLSFNDGYHILHHRNSQLHWSEFPSKLCSSLEEHAAAGALVFQGIGFFDVGLAVFTRRWGYLQRHLVRYSKTLAAMSEDEVVAMLHDRLKPVKRPC